MASWLVRSTPERVVRVWALAGDIVLCSWARNFTLTVPLSTQVYKWVLANCWKNLTNCGEVTCDGLASRPGEVEILLAASCFRNRNKLLQLWTSFGSKASLHKFELGYLRIPRYRHVSSKAVPLDLPVIYYQLFRTSVILNCFSFPLRVRNSGVELYVDTCDGLICQPEILFTRTPYSKMAAILVFFSFLAN